MSVRQEAPQAVVNAEFAAMWVANHMDENHPVFDAATQAARMERPASVVYFTDVTLRDGQQQRTDEVTTDQRLAVFKDIVDTGVDRIEIGHLGNKIADQPLAREIVKFISEQPEDARVHAVKLQVLFGSQPEIIKDGIDVLSEAFQQYYGDEWQSVMADKVVVHVYDRVDPNLSGTSSVPYGQFESAERVSSTAQIALDAGFKHLSISGEAATAVSTDEAIQYYRTITGSLINGGAETVNVNLANTYGFSANVDWNTHTLAAFNAGVKFGFDDKVTTSIHAHHDVDNAPDFTVKAIVAGFDRVESTHVGMGERAGNVAGIDVVARILEQARHQNVFEQRDTSRRSIIAAGLGAASLRRTVQLDPEIAIRLGNFKQIAERMCKVFGKHVLYRYERSAMGNPYAFDNGSGPHDQALAAAVMNPVDHPFDRVYGWALPIHHILGDQNAEDIAVGDPKAVDRVTVGNYAGGGKTAAIKAGTLIRAPEEEVQKAREAFRDRAQAIIDRVFEGVELVAA